MKTKSFIAAAALICLPSVASAFSLDFTGVALGTTVPPQLVIAVPGYGNVFFDVLDSSQLVIQTIDGQPSLAFGAGETLRIVFGGVIAENVAITTTGVDGGELFVLSNLPAVNAYNVVLIGGTDGAGLSTVSWTPIPEPSTALLGVLGTSLLVLRRRR